MAVYDGFFDFDQEVLEATGTYDREYNSADFTGFFEPTIGSGVYVGDNPGSMAVTLAGEEAHIAPGYLFLQGYWLKNDDNYTIPLTGSGPYAIAAHLDLSRRMIELVALPQADTYPDCLILALIDGTTVTDTRADPALCGLIDSAGSTAAKAAYAVQYIDNELEDRLAQAEADIAAQSAAMDAKIAEVGSQLSKLEPPPVGTIKFTASENVDQDWLPCDGRFVNEADYPDLVAALGKLTPGVENFKEAYSDTVGSGVTNGVVWGGRHWLFSLTDSILYCYNPMVDAVNSIIVTGIDKLQFSITNAVWLSITSDELFLSQNQGNTIIALHFTGFKGNESEIEMQPIDISAIISTGLSAITYNKPTLPGSYFAPEISEVQYNLGTSNGGLQRCFAMCVGYTYKTETVNSTYRHYNNVYYIIWSALDNEKSTLESISLNDSEYADTLNFSRAIFSFNHKNSNDLICLCNGYRPGATSATELKSVPSGIYNSGNYATQSIPSFPDDSITTIPIAGNGYYLYRCFMKDGKFFFRAAKYNPMTLFSTRVKPANVVIPRIAQTFSDSICYAKSHNLWLVFLGTGFAFSSEPDNVDSWGYLDTQEILGTITQFGSLDFDEARGTLYISGQDTNGKGKLGVLKFPDLYNYANDGAWLPQLASDGVPAYIKAIVTEIPSWDREVTIEVTNDSTFSEYYTILFNDEVLIGGKTYTRIIPEGVKTFTVGIEKTNPTNSYPGYLYIDNSLLLNISMAEEAGTVKTKTLRWEDYSDTITLNGKYILK